MARLSRKEKEALEAPLRERLTAFRLAHLSARERGDKPEQAYLERQREILTSATGKLGLDLENVWPKPNADLA